MKLKKKLDAHRPLGSLEQGEIGIYADRGYMMTDENSLVDLSNGVLIVRSRFPDTFNHMCTLVLEGTEFVV